MACKETAFETAEPRLRACRDQRNGYQKCYFADFLADILHAQFPEDREKLEQTG